MVSRQLIKLLISLAFAVIFNACVANEADCEKDNDCQSGYFCANGGGGVLFGGGICVSKKDDLLDATDFFDVGDLHDITDTYPKADADIKTDAVAKSDANTDTEGEEEEKPTGKACLLDTDCDPSEEGEWSTCDGFASSCASDGVQMRQIRSSNCTNGFCTEKTITKQRDCTRETAGNSCGTATESDFGECNFDGFKAREVSTPTCQDNTCEDIITTEELPCSCTTDASCGDVTYGNWSTCSFENTCASSGEKSREVRTPTCTNSSCSIVTTTETKECTRNDTTGNSCGTPSTESWSACSDTTSNTCALTGKRTQKTHTPTCQNDTCNVVTTTATDNNCTLTPPTSCGNITYTNWSACSFDSTCATSGTQTRTKTSPTCQSGTCSSVKTTETQSCSRETSGISCGSVTTVDLTECSFEGLKTVEISTPTCQTSTCKVIKTTQELPCACTSNASCGAVTKDAWSSCSFDSTCASSGTKNRKVHTPTCASGSCSIVTTTETDNCTRASTNGNSCGTPNTEPWSACTNTSSNTCALTGKRTQKTHTPTCQNDTCNVVTTTATDNNCALTPPTTCGSPTYTNWSLCSFPSACERNGTQTRTKTTPTCQSGTCSSVKTTETQTCTRNQPITCGNPTYTNWTLCAYPANNSTCALSGTQTRTKTTPTCQGKLCDSITLTETRNCGERNTSNLECGLASATPWGECTYNQDCANNGSRTRTTKTPICILGACTGSKSTTQTDTQGCTRNTNGNSCTAQGSGGQMKLGTCANECCDVGCPPNDPSCMQCLAW